MKSHDISFALLTCLSQPRISHIATLSISACEQLFIIQTRKKHEENCNRYSLIRVCRCPSIG